MIQQESRVRVADNSGESFLVKEPEGMPTPNSGLACIIKKKHFMYTFT